MKTLTKMIGVAGLMAMSGVASALTVSGLTWDPNYIADPLDPFGEKDFIAQFDFKQWYTLTITEEGNIPQYSNAVSSSNVFSVTGTPPNTTVTINQGYYLEGAGSWYSLNGVDPILCSNCEVTYAFGGIGLNTDSTFDISKAWAKVFVNDLSPDFSNPAGSQSEVDDALSGTLFLDLNFVSLGFASGTVKNGTVSAIFDIVGGSAAPYFAPAKLAYTADAFFSTGARYSAGGNGALIGDSNDIPEPSSVALLGLGLFSLGVFRRKMA